MIYILADTLACSECGFQREMPSSFLNISIDIPDQLENEEAVSKGYSLVELIDAQLQPETLEDDNKWECDQCKKKVLATKALEYQTLPRLLLLHLKRFRFDPVCVKLVLCCIYPHYINLRTSWFRLINAMSFILSRCLLFLQTSIYGYMCTVY